MTHQISVAKANDLIARFVANKEAIADGAFADKDVFSNSQTFEISSVLTMLGQTGTTGLRAYFGMYDETEETPREKRNKIVLVLCSSDIDNNDLHLAPDSDSKNTIILQDAILCPPFCPNPSQINNL
jgi:hypothetical protein